MPSLLICVGYSINAILISHFLLDLHEANEAKAHPDCVSGMEIIGTVSSSFNMEADRIMRRNGTV